MGADVMVIAERTTDVALISSIMTNPDIWSTVAEDGQSPDKYDPEAHAVCWLEMRNAAGIVVGLYSLEVKNGAMLEIHAQVLPEYRKEYSRETGLAALRWVYNEAPDSYQKLTAQVPDIYPNVIKFLLSFGFHREGRLAKSYRKNGELHDLHVFGLERREIGALIDG
jgi:hypothetical protein